MTKKILTLLLTFFTTYSFSCSCFPPPIIESLRYSDAIFVGRLIKIVDGGTSMYSIGGLGKEISFANFEVIKYMKGVNEYNKVVSLIYESNCSLRFSENELGDTLLIYANKINEDGFVNLLTSGLCSNSKLISEIIDPYEKTVYQDARIWKTPKSIENIKNEYNNKLLQELDIGEVKKIEHPHLKQRQDFLLVILVGINLLLTAYIIFRKNKL